MRIDQRGATRVVILSKRYAVKFPRIRIRLPLRRLTETLAQGGQEKVAVELKKYDRNIFIGGVKYLGLCAFPVLINWREYVAYRRHGDSEAIPLAPSIFSLFGFVNVQLRGHCFSSHYKKELAALERELRKASGRTDIYLEEMNVAVFDGVIKLIDYGDLDLGEGTVIFKPRVAQI